MQNQQTPEQLSEQEWQSKIDNITVQDRYYPDHTCDSRCFHNSSINTFDNAFMNSVLLTDKNIIKKWIFALLAQSKSEWTAEVRSQAEQIKLTPDSVVSIKRRDPYNDALDDVLQLPSLQKEK